MCKKTTNFCCGHSSLKPAKCRKIAARRRSVFGCFLDVFSPLSKPCEDILRHYNYRHQFCRACEASAPFHLQQPDDQYQPNVWSNINLGDEDHFRQTRHVDRQQPKVTEEEVDDYYLPPTSENLPHRHVRKDTVRFHGQSAARDLRRRDEIPLTPLRDAYLGQETSYSRSQRQGESSRSQHRFQKTSHSRSQRNQRSPEPSKPRSHWTPAPAPAPAPSLQHRIPNVQPQIRDFSLPDEPYMETPIPQAVQEPGRELTPIPAPVPPQKNPARGKTTRRNKTSTRTCPASRSEAFADRVSNKGFAEHRGEGDLIPAPLNLTPNRVLVPPPRPSRPAETSFPARESSPGAPSPRSAPLSGSRFIEHLDDDIISPLSPEDSINPQISGRYAAAHQTAVRSAGLCTFKNQQHLSPAQADFERPTTSDSAPTPRRRSFTESVFSAFQLRGKESDDSFACQTARAIEGSHKKKRKHHRRA